MVPRDRIELPTRGFSDQIFEYPKTVKLQAVNSIPIFQAIFGFVWNCLEIFDLDGHNLGTVLLNMTLTLSSPRDNMILYVLQYYQIPAAIYKGSKTNFRGRIIDYLSGDGLLGR